jgi:hypothetical protein
MAKVLYAILRLQHAQLPLPGATQKRIHECTKIPQPQISPILSELREAGYISEIAVRGQEALDILGAKKTYELDVAVSITCRDTAVMLLELLGAPRDAEGKIDFSEFLDGLERDKKLRYLLRADIMGTTGYPGKLHELVTKGLYLERVAAGHVRIRSRIHFERKYLEILRELPNLDKIVGFRFPASQPAKQPKKKRGREQS